MNASDFSVVDVPDRELSLVRADELGRAAQRALDRRAALQGGMPSTVTFIPRSPEAQAAWRRRKPPEPAKRPTAYVKRRRPEEPVPAAAAPAPAPSADAAAHETISPAADHDAQVKSRAVEGPQEDLVPGKCPNKPLMRKGSRFSDDAGKSASTSGIVFTKSVNKKEASVEDHVHVTIQKLKAKRDSIDGLIRDLESMFGTTNLARPIKPAPAVRNPRPSKAPQASARPAGNGVTAAVREAIATWAGSEFSNAQIAKIVRTKIPNVSSTQIAGAMSGLKTWGHIEMVRKDGPNPVWKAKG